MSRPGTRVMNLTLTEMWADDAGALHTIESIWMFPADAEDIASVRDRITRAYGAPRSEVMMDPAAIEDLRATLDARQFGVWVENEAEDTGNDPE